MPFTGRSALNRIVGLLEGVLRVASDVVSGSSGSVSTGDAEAVVASVDLSGCVRGVVLVANTGGNGVDVVVSAVVPGGSVSYQLFSGSVAAGAVQRVDVDFPCKVSVFAKNSTSGAGSTVVVDWVGWKA